MTATLAPAPALPSPRVVLPAAQLSAIEALVDRARTSLARPPATTESVAPGRDVVEEWGLQSFPASDPPSNW